jgi:hypothetical protein
MKGSGMTVDVDQVELRKIQAVVGTTRNGDPRDVSSGF